MEQDSVKMFKVTGEPYQVLVTDGNRNSGFRMNGNVVDPTPSTVELSDNARLTEWRQEPLRSKLLEIHEAR